MTLSINATIMLLLIIKLHLFTLICTFSIIYILEILLLVLSIKTKKKKFSVTSMNSKKKHGSYLRLNSLKIHR